METSDSDNNNKNINVGGQQAHLILVASNSVPNEDSPISNNDKPTGLKSESPAIKLSSPAGTIHVERRHAPDPPSGKISTKGTTASSEESADAPSRPDEPVKPASESSSSTKPVGGFTVLSSLKGPVTAYRAISSKCCVVQ